MTSPCLRNGCHACCLDTEMPLAHADVERLEAATGRSRGTFSEIVDGQRQLRNRDRADGARGCVFLDEAGRCTVYEHRPEGCRLYPLILDIDGPVRDSEHCPYTDEFEGLETTAPRLVDLVRRIETEDP